MYDKDFLLSVTKPARYIGQEINSVKKDHSRSAVKVCLCFPDIYEIGMSHHGMRILYDLINSSGDFLAERAFSPWTDMEEKMRRDGLFLSSIESGVAVKEFDILGFSLQYELCYTNVLNILSLSGIPLRSKERGSDFPLIIAGGACCFNPGPMSDFIDLFVIGEAEELMLEILDIYRRHKAAASQDKEVLLKSLSALKGVYVPSISLGQNRKVSKRFISDLNASHEINNWIVPYIEIVHDRIGIEIMRGCPNRCRFCQARSCFFPPRLVKKEKIIDAARRLYCKTGYEEIALLSLSSSDHPDIEEIVKNLTKEFKDFGVSLSLPSIRAKGKVSGISGNLASARKTALTFAPEAGSQRLRDLINKNIDINELREVSLRAYHNGYRLLKLYFMIGLPTENKDDLDEIFVLCRELSQLKKTVDGHPARLNVSISNFVPKPHTPFQWQPMLATKDLSERQRYLKGLFYKSKGLIKLKFHDTGMSFIEGVLSRGDEKLSTVIEGAFLAGAKFDAWDSMFNLSLWNESFLNNSIDPCEYLRKRDLTDVLSWDFIDMGFPRDQLSREAEAAFGP